MADLDEIKLIDISPLISARTAVFPGDTKFSRHVDLNFERGDNLVLSHIESTVHIGAHADAPNHYHRDGKGIHERDLSLYLGRAQVIEVNVKAGTRISPADFSDEITAKRVLFKTNSFPDPNNWNGDFVAFAPETITFLAGKGVVLIGIDTPSVDPADDKELFTHNTIYKNDMAILEGIVLTDVTPGNYQLIALPLNLEDADASPVRAVLFKE